MSFDPNLGGGSHTEDLEQLLKENLKYNKAIYADTQQIRKYLKRQFIISMIYWLLIILPILASLFFLPSFIGNFLGQLDGQNQIELIKELEETLKK